MKTTGIDRRSALRILGSAPIALGIAALESAQAHAAAAVAAAAGGKPYAPKFFTAHEWQTVRMLVDLVIPKDERSGSATEAGVPEFMDYIMLDPAEDERGREHRQTAMRGGLAWLDNECRHRFGGKTFLDCAPQERTALLDDIAYWKPEPAAADDDGPREPRDRAQVRLKAGASFFNSFRDLTASGFFSSKIGVADVGYKGNTSWQWDGPPPEVLARLGVQEDKR